MELDPDEGASASLQDASVGVADGAPALGETAPAPNENVLGDVGPLDPNAAAGLVAATSGTIGLVAPNTAPGLVAPNAAVELKAPLNADVDFVAIFGPPF